MDAVKLQQEFVERKNVKIYSDKNPTVMRTVPKGYMTGEEFVKVCIEDLEVFCKKHGLL